MVCAGVIILKFETLEFKGKNGFRASAISSVYKILGTKLDLDKFSTLEVQRYLEILLDDQDFNPKTKVFYDKVSNRKLNYEFLASVAHDYILEHADEFKKNVK